MMASKYNGGSRGDMGGFSFGPPAGTTTYGGPGVTRLPGGIQPRYGPMWAAPGGPRFAGDPGFFDFVGKAIKGVTGVVSRLGIPGISGAAGLVSGFLGGGRGPGMPGVQQIPLNLMQQGGTPAGMRKPGLLALGQQMVPGGETGMGAGCGQGYRPNKSGYYVNGGQYVAPGTTCVKRRRMNPLNPRALSKAMRRIESAKRATTVLNRITIRKKC